MLLLAIERGEKVTPVFADTGNEHPLTYEYIEYLSEHVAPIITIKADFSKLIEKKRETVEVKWRKNGIPEEEIERTLAVLKPTGVPFLDLCLWKGRFPSGKARFCTQELKVLPIELQVIGPLIDAGEEVVSWQGVRKQESISRANLAEREKTIGYLYAYEIYRPLLEWSYADAFEMHKKHGIEPNPLYKQGMGRVGCMPCIFAKKNEILEISKRFPEQIDRIREWEFLVSESSKRKGGTFFSTDDHRGNGIDEIVEWSNTKHGGREIDPLKQEPPAVYSSIYGLCE